MNDLDTIVVIRLHEIDDVDADRNAYSLKEAKFLVDDDFVLKIANQNVTIVIFATTVYS